MQCPLLLRDSVAKQNNSEALAGFRHDIARQLGDTRIIAPATLCLAALFQALVFIQAMSALLTIFLFKTEKPTYA